MEKKLKIKRKSGDENMRTFERQRQKGRQRMRIKNIEATQKNYFGYQREKREDQRKGEGFFGDGGTALNHQWWDC